jgi:hypothetical protein
MIGFSQDMNIGQALKVNNYHIYGPMSSPGVHSRNLRSLAIRGVSYNAATRTVTLVLKSSFNVHSVYQLIVSAGSGGLTSNAGVPLAGQGSQPGTNYVAYLNRNGLFTSSTAVKPAKASIKPIPAKPARAHKR